MAAPESDVDVLLRRESPDERSTGSASIPRARGPRTQRNEQTASLAQPYG